MFFHFAANQTVDVRSHYIDVLRGAAALAVFVAHADHNQLVDLSLSSNGKGWLGTLGVSLFFVLSGYLIWNSGRALRQPDGLRIYAINRITRLYPLVVINVGFVMWAVPHLPYGFDVKPSAEALIRHLTLTQDLNPSVSRDLNPVLWTLTHEALFYLTVPFLVRLPLLAVPTLGLLAYLASVTYGGTFAPFMSLFYLFTIGILLAEKRFSLAVVVALVFTGLRYKYSGIMLASVVPASLLIVVIFFSLPSTAHRLTRPLKWVGVVSFSLYIWHYLLLGLIGNEQGLRVMHNLLGSLAGNNFWRAAFTTTIMLSVSGLSYWLIERPGMTRLRQFLIRLSKTPAHGTVRSISP